MQMSKLQIESTVLSLLQEMQSSVEERFNAKIDELQDKNEQLSRRILELEENLLKNQTNDKTLVQTFDPKFNETQGFIKQSDNRFATVVTPKKTDKESKNKLFFTSPIHMAICQSPKAPDFAREGGQTKPSKAVDSTKLHYLNLPSIKQIEIMINGLSHRLREIQFRSMNSKCKCQFLVDNFIRNQQHLLNEIKMIKYGGCAGQQLRTPKNKRGNINYQSTSSRPQ